MTAAHEMQHGKAVWLSHGFMFGRLVIGLGAAVPLSAGGSSAPT